MGKQVCFPDKLGGKGMMHGPLFRENCRLDNFPGPRNPLDNFPGPRNPQACFPGAQNLMVYSSLLMPPPYTMLPSSPRENWLSQS